MSEICILIMDHNSLKCIIEIVYPIKKLNKSCQFNIPIKYNSFLYKRIEIIEF